MEAAKLKVSVDERFFEHSKQECNWRKPTDQVAKFKLSCQMESDLDESDIPEDLKVEKYNQDLTTFIQTKHKVPSEWTSVILENNKIAPVEEKVAHREEESPVERKSVKRSRVTLLTPLHSSRIKWVRKAPRKFAWDE